MLFVLRALILLGPVVVTVNACCCCCCGCGCGCYNPPPIPNTILSTTVMPDTNNTGNGNGNMNAQTSRLRMRDYLKITEMLDGKPKSRARRYNYDLSEVMNADDDSRIDKQELGLEQDLGLRQVKASKPKLSLIGAVNPMQLPGSPFIPAPKRKIPSTPKEGVGRVSCPSTNDSV